MIGQSNEGKLGILIFFKSIESTADQVLCRVPEISASARQPELLGIYNRKVVHLVNPQSSASIRLVFNNDTTSKI